MAFSSVLNATDMFVPVLGKVVTIQEGTIIVDAFAMLLISSLTITLLLGVTLLLLNRRRRSNSWSDPSSMTNTVSLISESTQMLCCLQISTPCSWSMTEATISLQKGSQGPPYRLDVLAFKRTSRKVKAKDIITVTSLSQWLAPRLGPHI